MVNGIDFLKYMYVGSITVPAINSKILLHFLSGINLTDGTQLWPNVLRCHTANSSYIDEGT